MYVGLVNAVPVHCKFVVDFLIIINISSALAYFHWYSKNNIRVKFNTNTQTTIPLKYKWKISKK